MNAFRVRNRGGSHPLRRAEDQNRHGRRRWDHPRRRLLWFLCGMAAVPLVVIPHEIAHFVAARVQGLADASLHYAGVGFRGGELFWEQVRRGNWSAAASVAAPRAVLWTLAAGPLSTLLLAVGGLGLIHRTRVRSPLVLATALFATLSFLPLPEVVELAATGTLAPDANDERRIALLLQVPLWTSWVAKLALAVLLLAGFAGTIAERRRPDPRLPLLLGYLYGLLFYAFLLGPLLIG